MPTGIPVFGDDSLLSRYIAAREHAIPLLATATSDAERLKAMLLLTNMSKYVLDRTTAIMHRLKDPSLHDVKRQAGLKWAKGTVEAMADTNAWSARQQALAVQLGDQAKDVLSEVRAMVDDLLDPGRSSSGAKRPVPFDLAGSLPILGEDEELGALISAHNDGVALLRSASDDTQRLTGLVLVTNCSEQMITRLGVLIEAIGALPAVDPARDEAADFARRLLGGLRADMDLVAEQTALAAELGEEAANVALSVASKHLARIAGTGTAASTLHAADDENAKTCPDCAETIKSTARVCRFCGYRFSPSS